MSGTPSIVNLLRIWIGLIGMVAVGSTIRCFIAPNYAYEMIFSIDQNNVSALTSRLFGVWTFLSGVVRVMCAFDLHNRSLYHLTLFTFVLALVYFVSEVFIYKTAKLESAGILAPLLISSSTIVLMLVGYWFVETEDLRAKLGDENESLVTKAKKKK
ncbi:hypothetical protein EGW08_010504 [Elysia chlorotica]|uniref:Ergosterol biosynthetic protein 28 n=1 Tax=Elysia chlorotica TaxID=188477 RepID=A0A433TJI9_ELYCH|nr:hypothetical protein EGW08_010504 [Elysia chlorotica]